MIWQWLQRLMTRDTRLLLRVDTNSPADIRRHIRDLQDRLPRTERLWQRRRAGWRSRPTLRQAVVLVDPLGQSHLLYRDAHGTCMAVLDALCQDRAIAWEAYDTQAVDQAMMFWQCPANRGRYHAFLTDEAREEYVPF